jgi:hypothetical protein
MDDFFGMGSLNSGILIIIGIIFFASTTIACCVAGNYFYRKFTRARKAMPGFSPPPEWTSAKNIYVEAKGTGREKEMQPQPSEEGIINSQERLWLK